MNTVSNNTWYEANQAHLAAALAELRAELGKSAPQPDSLECPDKQFSTLPVAEANETWQLPQQPALETLCSSFELSGFERKVLLMCAGAELDARFPALYAALHKDARRTQPTFSLALSAFPEAHWSALTPVRPLRWWQLLEVGGGETLATSPLRIQERVLHHLAGLHCLDERLQPLVKPAGKSSHLAPSHLALARQIATAWSQASAETGLPVVQLCGNANAGKRAIAADAASVLGLRLHVLATSRLPHTASEMDTLLRLWEREAVLSASALLLECDDDAPDSPITAISWLMEMMRSPLVISTRSSRKSANRPVLLLDVDNPTKEEQAELWHNTLQSSFPQFNGKVEALISQFNLGPAAIESASYQAVSNLTPRESAAEELAERLWDACRTQARPRLEGLAQRIDPAASWDDLVLPESQKQVLRQIAVHVRQRSKVYQTWGFAAKGSRGLGISALFAGPSGTGKTMAAEVLAHELRLDLYRVDLSQVVSKYIGETEKNLRRVFDAAEEGAAVLLFDEADALFGKRSEVKDSHDRYANIEVSYLLQRMEAYRGLAILTTNRKSALDQAFLRRIRFVMEFPFPEMAQRIEIWRHVFPQATPTEDLRIERLARLNATGGHIRNIAVGAAFLAADAGEPVRMSHLLHAARDEFAKSEKPLPESEVTGWA